MSYRETWTTMFNSYEDSTGGNWSYPVDVVTTTEQRSDPVKRIKPRGVELLFSGTPVESIRSWSTPAIETFTETSGGVTATTRTVFEGNANPPEDPAFKTGSENWANKLILRIQDTKLNLAQAFAERKQTERMFIDFGGRIVKSYRALRKGRPQDVYSALTGGKTLPRNWKRGFKPDVLNTMSSNWLAWQYGVRPLVQDLAGSVSEYLRARGVKPLIRRYRVYSSQANGQGWTFGTAERPGSATFDGTYQVYVSAAAEFEDDGSQFEDVASRLGLTNPVLLLWEIIPLSFVVDWFLNVGDYLSASARIAGLLRVGISETVVEDRVVTRTLGGGTAVFKRKTKTRSFHGSLPSPVLGFNGGINSWSRAFSALALLRQRTQSSGYPSKQ